MKDSLRASRWILLSAAIVLLLPVLLAQAQENKEAAMKAAAEAMMKARQGGPAGPGGPPGQQPPGGPGGPPGQQPPGQGGDAGKKPDEAKTVKRPDKPSAPPNPKELEILPDGDNKIKLNFNGQPWPAVLEWVGKISAMSLDWRELPDDYVNLTTQRSYTVPEVRGLINRHLLMRGFTMLCNGEMLTVTKTKDIDPSLVPRINPKELDQHDPHEFAKVSFVLDWMMAENALKELTPLKSANGKLNALKETNRIEALDAVTNLCDMYKLLNEEQSDENKKQLMKKFQLHYTRASDVLDQLQTLMEIEKKSGPKQPMTPEQMQQQAMMAQQRAQQGGGQPGQQPPGGAAEKARVTLAANTRENSILACATPDKMAVIAQIIDAIDVEPNDPSRSLVGDINRMNPYRVVGIDPEMVVKTLMEVGNFSPTTRLEVDKKNKVIIANAPLADHMVIQAIVKKLCGSERKFKVIPLLKLPADSVAASIEFMMGIDTKKKKERPNYFNMWSGGRDSSSDKTDEFRVEADQEGNRLMLKGNEVELAEVDNLLVQLGEKKPEGGNPATRRVIDLGSPEEAQEFLERLQSEWRRLAPNQLSLPPSAPKKTKADEKKKEKRETIPQDDDLSSPSKTTMRQPDGAIRLTQLRVERDADDKADSDRAVEPSPPPVTVSVGPDGRIVIASEDTQALDLLEEMASQMASRPQEYKSFRLTFASAYEVRLILEDYFKDEKKAGSRMPYWMMWEFGDDQEESGSDDQRLSKRRKIKFISHSDSNTILVQGAQPSQLKVVEDLIKLYDQPAPTDTETERITKMIPLRYSKAKEVEQTVKEVYRDLLSANDKALQGPNQQQGRGGGFSITYDLGSRGGDKGEQKVPRFKGLLSIGINETSNSLTVSAPKFLFNPVVKMIEELDNAAAANNAVRMVKVGPGMSAEQLQDVLDSLMNPGSSKRSKSKADNQPQTKKPPGKQGQRTESNRNAGQGKSSGNSR